MEAATESWVAEMDGRGVRREGAPLRPVREAAVVRIRDGEVLVSDGPFAETKEQIAGYDVVECSSLAEAIEVAAKHPVARFGAIEVRPFNPGGWWRSADRRGPGDGPEYLMVHRVDETATLDPADDCEVPGSAAARAQQAWDDETYARGVKLAGGRLQSASRGPDGPRARRERCWSPTGRSPRPRSRSPASTCSPAPAWPRPSRSRPSIRPPGSGPSSSARSLRSEGRRAGIDPVSRGRRSPESGVRPGRPVHDRESG